MRSNLWAQCGLFTYLVFIGSCTPISTKDSSILDSNEGNGWNDPNSAGYLLGDTQLRWVPAGSEVQPTVRFFRAKDGGGLLTATLDEWDTPANFNNYVNCARNATMTTVCPTPNLSQPKLEYLLFDPGKFDTSYDNGYQKGWNFVWDEHPEKKALSHGDNFSKFTGKHTKTFSGCAESGNSSTWLFMIINRTPQPVYYSGFAGGTGAGIGMCQSCHGGSLGPTDTVDDCQKNYRGGNTSFCKDRVAAFSKCHPKGEQ